jgi:predicted NAD/FAD-binding protein
MPDEHHIHDRYHRERRSVKIAIVGAGIAGLAAAYTLDPDHDVSVFEAAGDIGGHARTVSVRDAQGLLGIDTGFIVYNTVNYPGLVSFLRALGVATLPSEMSFSVSCRQCGFAFSSRRPHSASPRFVRDLARFQRSARARVAAEDYQSASIGAFAASERYSEHFTHHFLVALCAAIWSAPTASALTMPARYVIGFLAHHGVLGFRHHRWRTVSGGSRSYLDALALRLRGQIHRRCPVRRVERGPGGVVIHTDTARHHADRVVIATHADQALRLLADATPDEQRLLGAFASTENEAVLHTDQALLPTRTSQRASWNYHLDACRPDQAVPTLTYYMNRLQRLDSAEHYCVTLNQTGIVKADRVLDRVVFRHPLQSFATMAAQSDLGRLNGPLGTAYAGAWQGYGFHEDGYASGVRAAEALTP